MAIDATERLRLQSYGKIVVDNLSHQLRSTSNMLNSIRGDLPFLGAQKEGGALVNRRLKSMSEVMQGVRTLVVLDATGTVSASNRAELIGRNFREREYFRVPEKERNPAVLYVSPPFRTVLGAFSVGLSMVLIDAQGEFSGVISATLDPDYFRSLIDSILYAPDVRASIVDRDGTIFVTLPQLPGLDGMNLAKPGTFFTRHQDSGQRSSLFSGTVYATGDERIMHQRTVRIDGLTLDRPFVFAVSRDLPMLFADWRADAYAQAGGFCLLALLASSGLHLYQRRERTYYHLLVAQEAKRNQADEALRKSEERFRTIVNQNSAVILEIDPSEGRILDANPAACRFYGWSHDVLCSKSITDINQLDPEAVQAEYRAAAKLERNFFIFPHRVASGEIRTVEVHSTPVTINEKPVLISIILDITSRIAAEEVLAQESSKRAAELIVSNIANKELIFQSGEKARRAAELVLANMELAFQNEEKAKRAAELVLANVELAFQSEEKAKRAAELMETASDGIHVLDEQGRLTQCSRSFARMLGYTQEEIFGRKIIDWDAKFSSSQLSQMLKDLIAAPRIFESIHRRKDGTFINVEINAKGIRIGGKDYLYASSRDITERKQLQEQILQLAFYDPLTKLANRRLLDDRLNQILAENRRNHCHGAVLFVDLDNFKALNDAHGHDAGDLLLIEVAQRLKSSVREVDTVARTGGDEFVVVISELEQDLAIARHRALAIAEKIRLTLARPYILEMHRDNDAASKVEHHCTASIGVALFSGDAVSKDQLLTKADNAMFQAKVAGRDRIQIDGAVL